MADNKGYGDSGTQKGGQQGQERKEGQPSPDRDESQRGQQGSRGGQQGGAPKRDEGFGEDINEPRPGDKRASDASTFDEEDEEEVAG